MTLELTISGFCPGRSITLIRTTVPWSTTAPPALTVPFRTLVTKSSANPLSWTDVRSHGPLMFPPDHVSTGDPTLLRTIRHPASGVPVPASVTGRLPTTTNPLLRTVSAVVSPTPPGHFPGRGPVS